MTEYVIDLNDVFNADELHAAVAQALPLPDYYGGTLDALYDVLTEQTEGWDIRFIGCADAEITMDKYMRKLRKMCDDACRFNDNFLRIAFEE